MRVGIYARTDSGVVRDVLYTIDSGRAVPDKPDVPTHKNLESVGVRFRKKRYFPRDGEDFLKALLEQMRGSYMWAKREE